MLHIVLGDGEMSLRELSKTLEDLVERAAGEDFWMVIQGKPEPSTTDKNLVKWLNNRKVWFEVLTDDPKAMSDIYSGAQDTHTVSGSLADVVVEIMQTRPENDEGLGAYGLFVDNDDEVPEDAWLNDVMTAVAEAGFTVFAMNDGLAELEFADTGEAEEEEAEPVASVTPIKSKTSKTVAPVADEGDEDEPEEEPEEAAEGDDHEYTEKELVAMNIEQLKAIAAKKGIEVAPRSRMPTYIRAILGQAEESPVAEVEEVHLSGTAGTPSVNGSESAMLVIMYNGTVSSRLISVAEALAFLES